MATFNVGIGKDDIQEAVLLEEDWYTVEITKEPYEAKNAAWKDAGESLTLDKAHEKNEKAGQNIIVHLKIESEIPEAHGRTLTKWLSLPNKFDEGQYMNDGQPKADWKADIIHKWAEAFGSGSEGAEATLSLGSKALVYVVQEKDQSGENDVNNISMNVHPRSLTAGSASPLEDGKDPFEQGLL